MPRRPRARRVLAGRPATTDRMITAVVALEAPAGVMNSGFASAFYAAQILVVTDRYERRGAARDRRCDGLCQRHTEWEPFATVVSAYARGLQGHPIEALDLLHRAHQSYMRWQPSGIGLDIGDLLRADILGTMDRGDEAFEILAALNPHERHALCPERFMARLALQHGDLRGADVALADCELLGEAHSPRTLIDVQLLRGAIEMERGNLRASDVSIDRALHAMARTGVRSPFRHVPPALLARIAERALARKQERGSHAHPPRRSGDRRRGRRSRSPERARAPGAGLRRAQAHGRADRGRTVHLPNTVKTHLRRLYRKLGVATREEAIRKARSLGLHVDSGS